MNLSMAEVRRVSDPEWKQKVFQDNSNYFDAIKGADENGKRAAFSQLLGRLGCSGMIGKNEFDEIMAGHIKNPPTDDDVWLLILLNAL